MPPVIAFVVTYATAITVGVTIASAGISLYNQKKQAKKMAEDFRRQQEAQDALDKQLASQESIFYGGGGGASLREDTKLMLKSSKSPRNVVFGRDRVSGPMMPFFSYEQNNVLYHRFGVVLAGHECDAVETVYFDDEPVTLDAAGWVIAPAKYTDNGRSLFFVEKKLGGPAQTASQFLIDAAAYAGTPSAWGADRKAIGVCYVVVHMEANYDVLHDIGLPNVSAIVRGVKAYDPRTNTTVWTRNPALLARWWLVDSIYSPLTVDADIDQAELIASANVCDELVAFSATVTAQRYACDGALNTNANPLENLNKIMSAMDGDAVWVSGKWQLIAGYYKPPTLAINESHVAGGQITISPYAPTAQIINAISGQFKGPDTKYQAAGYPMIAPPVYLAEDGGEFYERKDDFDLVNDAMRCQMIAWQRLSRARQQLGVNMVCNLKAYDTSPLQTVSLSLAEFGYSNKVFQVRKRIFNGYAVEYFLQETGAAVWAWNYALVNQPVEIPNININVDLTVAALQNVVVASGTEHLVIDADGTVRSRIYLTWDLVASTFVKNGGQIEWQYRKADTGSGAGPWINNVKTAGNAVSTYIQPVEDGVAYDLRGRAVSQLGRRGAQVLINSYVVIGKTEPPPDVEGFGIDGTVLNCLPVDILDLAGYVLRFNYGNNINWEAATPINSGVITQFPFDLVARPTGLTTLMCKAVDTTGNESLNAATIFANLIAPRIANLVHECTFFPNFTGIFFGVLNAGLFSEGVVKANVDGAGYAQLQYTSGIVVVQGIPANCTMHLPIEYEGEGLTIEYRQTGPSSFFGELGTDPHFGASGTDPYFGPAGPWLPWPGVLAAANDGYEFRFTIAAGAVRGVINTAALRVSAPPVSQVVANYPIAAIGSTIPHNAGFTRINSVQATLQAGTSGARTIEVDTSDPLAPKVYAFDSAHNLVGGASADLTLEGY